MHVSECGCRARFGLLSRRVRPKQSFLASCFVASALPACHFRTCLGDSGPRPNPHLGGDSGPHLGTNSGPGPSADNAFASYSGPDRLIGPDSDVG